MVELITYPILMKRVVIINVAVVVCIMILPSSSSTLAFTPPDRRIPTIKSSTFCRIDLESLQHRRRINRISCINNIRYQQRLCSSLNLVPFPEAWNDANYVDDGMHQSFSTLLYNINCQSLDSDGILISSSSFLSNEQKKKQYRLYLATDVDDLPPIAKLTLDVFDVSAIAMSNAVDWNAVEAALVGSVVAPAVGAYNAWAYSVGYTEVLSGLRSRMRNRIINVVGGEERKWNDWLAPLVAPDNIGTSSYNSSSDKSLQDIASRSSLILALAHITPLDSQEGKEEIEVIASIELRLQPTDAKIPFSQPWLDVIERKLVRFTLFGKSIHHPPLRPYLCNLCISPKFTRLGIGRALCRIVEAIAQDKWSYSQIYLHVDPANVAAMQLYEKEGYVDVGSRWNAFWAGGANEISYFVKRLRTGLEQ